MQASNYNGFMEFFPSYLLGPNTNPNPNPNPKPGLELHNSHEGHEMTSVAPGQLGLGAPSKVSRRLSDFPLQNWSGLALSKIKFQAC